jgi:dihydrofolate reductase
MARVVLSFSMSLDGYVAGPDVSPEHPMGKGGERLHEWMFPGEAAPRTEADAQEVEQIMSRVGAVVLGNRTFEIGLNHWKDTPFPAPSFVLTHQARPAQPMKSASFTFVTNGVHSAIAQSKAAAGDRDVVVMGAETAHQVLKAGLADDLHLQLVPVLLCGGSRPFDDIGSDQIELRQTRLVPSTAVTHMDFAILR